MHFVIFCIALLLYGLYLKIPLYIILWQYRNQAQQSLARKFSQPAAININNTMSKQHQQSNSNLINQSDGGSPLSNQSNQKSGKGRWTQQECELFEYLLERDGEDWKLISKQIKTRSYSQVRSHAQKYFNRKNKESEKIGNNERNIIGNKEDSTLTRARKRMKGDTSGDINELSQSNRTTKPKEEVQKKKKTPKSEKKQDSLQMDIEQPAKIENSQQNIIIEQSDNRIMEEEKPLQAFEQRLENSVQKINFKPRRQTAFKRVHSVRSFGLNWQGQNADLWVEKPFSQSIQRSATYQSFFQAAVIPILSQAGMKKCKDFNIFTITSKPEVERKDKM